MRAGFSVINERSMPSDDRQVAPIIRNARLHDLGLFTFGERNGFAAHDLRDFSSMGAHQLRCGGTSRDFFDSEDKIIFVQPVLIRFDQCSSYNLQLFLGYGAGLLLQPALRHPTAGKINEGPPISLERNLKDEAHDSVVVILDGSLDGLTAINDKQIQSLDHRRTNELGILIGGMLLQPLPHAFCAQDAAQLIKIDLFANIEEI